MATITKEKYGEGHEVQLKPSSPNQIIKDKFKDYIFGKSVFKKTIKTYKPTDFNVLIDLDGKESVQLMDDKNKLILIKGDEKSISNIFNHFGAGGKADTVVGTEVKENMSMILFRASKMLTEEEAVNELEEMMGDRGLKVYTTKDYDSAVNQLGVFKKFFWIYSRI